MARKLAITISGAVSLGSYESGVVFEVLNALSQHNAWAAATNQPDERIEIDVLTGASAGGMTVAMVAQRLLYDGAAMAAAYDNPLYCAWVQDVDITGLLARQKDELASLSVLSSDLVISISEKYLMGRYPQPGPALAAAVPHAALGEDGMLSLGLALSNLNGVDYERVSLTKTPFVYTRHAEEYLRPQIGVPQDQHEFWDDVRAKAVACGAFPLMFRTQDLVREISDFEDSPFLVKELWNGEASTTFTYTDGGVFQNEPLGMAKNLVDLLPGGHLNAGCRGYLYIAPKPKSSQAVGETTFSAATADYKTLGLRLANAVFEQAGFQDWAMAEQVNQKLEFLDARADELQALFASGRLTAAMTAPVAAVLLPAFFPATAAASTEVQLEAARAQLATQYTKEYTAFGADLATANAWLDSVLVLELAAGLHWKEEMQIYDFVAEPDLLASGGMVAFGGFFDVRYRKHDYDYGRSVAQARLRDYAGLAGSVFANLHWTPTAIDAIDPALNNLQMTSVDQGLREKVASQLDGAANALLQELGLDELERLGVNQCLLEKQIKGLLSL
jgi:hypothetical protein